MINKHLIKALYTSPLLPQTPLSGASTGYHRTKMGLCAWDPPGSRITTKLTITVKQMIVWYKWEAAFLHFWLKLKTLSYTLVSNVSGFCFKTTQKIMIKVEVCVGLGSSIWYRFRCTADFKVKASDWLVVWREWSQRPGKEEEYYHHHHVVVSVRTGCSPTVWRGGAVTLHVLPSNNYSHFLLLGSHYSCLNHCRGWCRHNNPSFVRLFHLVNWFH